MGEVESPRPHHTRQRKDALARIDESSDMKDPRVGRHRYPSSMLSRRVNQEEAENDRGISPMFGSRVMGKPIPRYDLPDDELPAAAAYQLIHDEMTLDGTPLLNLATFVTTWM